MQNPSISVVMVAWNVEHFLAEAIESILGQSFKDFEFIIIDYGSTDNSKTIIASYAARDSRILFREIPHCSLPQARNAACQLARGQYMAIMDADDTCPPDRLLSEIDFMERHPDVALLGGAAEWMNASGQTLFVHVNPTGHQEIMSAMVTGCALYHPTALLRKQAFTRVGGYRTAFHASHDYDLFLRVAELYECANLKQVLLKRRIHPHQLSLHKRAQQTLCKLAAQVSAFRRRSGRPDPFNSTEEITPEVLAQLGVTYARQQSEMASGFRDWIRFMCMAGEYSSALRAAIEMAQSSDWKYVERWQIADLYLTISRLYWRQKSFWKSFLAAGHAVAVRPVVLGRPLKRLALRLGSM
jgi:glycosyltransferase involved in cell wall biosynthesis